MIRGDPTLLLLVAAIAIAIAFLAVRCLPLRPGWRTAAVAPPLLLALAAIGFTTPGGQPAGHVLLIDISRSTGLDAPNPLVVARSAGVDPEGASVMLFGRAAVRLPGGPEGEVLVSDLERAGPLGSDLAGAIASATATLPSGGRITVATDGRVDLTSAARAVAVAAGAGVHVVLHPLGRERRGDARVTSLSAPSRISAGARAAVVVSVAGEPGEQVGVSLNIDGEPAAASAVVLGSGGAASLRMELPLLGAGFHSVEARVVRDGPDAEPGNDRIGAGIVVTSGRKAYIAGSPPRGIAPGFEAKTWDPHDAVPEDADLLILSNVPSTEMAEGGAAIVRFVAGGGGLIVAGGDRSFGAGAYSARPIEDCLPVLSGVTGGRLRVTVLLDRSATMGEPFHADEGGAKLDAARAAGRRLLSSLPPGATITIATFAREVESVGGPFDLTAEDGRRLAMASLNEIGEAGGGTALAPPLSLVLADAERVAGDRWLAILVTDGRLETEEPERPVALAAALERAGCRLAVLAVGEDADLDLLRRLAGDRDPAVVSAGGEFAGAFLDALIETEAEGQISRGRTGVSVGPGLDPPWVGTLPAVLGYVRTQARPAAEVWFETGAGDPLAAGWRFGLGRAVTLPAGIASGWTPGWAETPAVAAFAGWAARPAASGGIRGEVSVSPEGTFLEVRLPARTARAEGVLMTADGRQVPVVLMPTGSGTWRTRLNAQAPGAARLSVTAGGETYSGGISIPYEHDLGPSGPDLEALESLSRALGEPPSGGGGRSLSFIPAALALLVFLGDRAMMIRRRRLKGRGGVDR